MVRNFFAALLVMASAFCSAQDTYRESATTPDKAYPAEFASNKPFVEVRLNGSRPLHFILDAGSPLAGIDTTLVTSLGFRPGKVISRAGGAGQSGGLIMELLPKACEEMGGARECTRKHPPSADVLPLADDAAILHPRGGNFMKTLFWFGLVVLALGIISLFVAIPRNEREGIRAGGVDIGVQMKHSERVSPIVTAVLIIGGASMMIAGGVSRAK